MRQKGQARVEATAVKVGVNPKRAEQSFARWARNISARSECGVPSSKTYRLDEPSVTMSDRVCPPHPRKTGDFSRNLKAAKKGLSRGTVTSGHPVLRACVCPADFFESKRHIEKYVTLRV